MDFRSSKIRTWVCDALLGAAFAGMLGLFASSSKATPGPNGRRIKGTNTRYELGDWISYSVMRYVNSVAVGDQYVYFATTGGIGRYDRFRDSWDFPWTVSNGLADNNVISVAYDPGTGFLWCATETAVSYLHPASKLWSNSFSDEIGLTANDIVTAIGFDDHSVFIETQGGKFFNSDRYSASFFPVSGGALGNMFWAGGKNSKTGTLPHLFTDADVFFDDRGFLQDMNLRTFPITCFSEDSWQYLWVGTWGLGVGKADMRSERLTLLPFGLLQKGASVVAKNGDEIWIAGFDKSDTLKGITLWTGADDWRYFEGKFETGFSSDNVNAMVVDDNNIWLATDQGLVWHDRGRDLWRTFNRVEMLPDEWVYDVEADSQYVWAATARGVTRFDRNSLGTDSLVVNLIEWRDLGDVEVYDLELMHNLVWMGTEYGLYLYDNAKEKGGYYRAPEGPVGWTIRAVSVYGEELWLGTLDGVEAFNTRTRQWLKIPTQLYRIGMPVNRILADETAVWATTNNGVWKFDRERKRWRSFTVEDGLLDDEVHSLFVDGDYIWFGTPSGITRFYWNSPDRID